MLDDNEKKIIADCFANLKSRLPNFKSRPTQRRMIAEIANTLACASNDEVKVTKLGESIVVIEGPTGTGKSIGYLLPAIVMAKAREKHLVVSSATITLQEQLANKDIPILTQQGGLNFNYVIAKGRGRYVCTNRLQQYSGISQQENLTYESNDEFAMWDHKPSVAELESLTKLSELLKKQEWSGDRDTLSFAVPDSLWQRITNDRDGCIKRNCVYFTNCPFFKARDEMEKVDVIIANHDLLLADLAMGGGVILPPPNKTFYCIDEAHNLSEKAIKQFAASHTLYGSIAWLEKINPTTIRIATLLKSDSMTQKIAENAANIVSNLREFGMSLSDIAELTPNEELYDPATLRFKNGKLPETFNVLRDNLTLSTKSLLTTLLSLQDQLKKTKGNNLSPAENPLFEKALTDIGFLIGRVENIALVWTLLATETPANIPPIAKWISAHKNKNDLVEYTICASPVRAAKLLAEKFWNQAAGAVLTSATLRSLGSFDMLLAETGLQHFPKTKCVALDSPFDFKQQGKLIIPPMKSDPTNPVMHTQEIIELIPKFLPTEGGNGALVLFSSKKQMQEVAQNLPENIQQFLLIQGEKPKATLLETHFSRIANDQPSILFGLASFAEGLDLPGNACNHLIIAKLPFAVPDDPVSQTLAEWTETQGGKPFFEITLPAACIKLIQAVGRLIRSETDTGIVVIFDARLERKSYGRLIKKSLPPFEEIKYKKAEVIQ